MVIHTRGLPGLFKEIYLSRSQDSALFCHPLSTSQYPETVRGCKPALWGASDSNRASLSAPYTRVWWSQKTLLRGKWGVGVGRGVSMKALVKVRWAGFFSSCWQPLGATKVRQSPQPHQRWCEHGRNVTHTSRAPDKVDTDTASAAQNVSVSVREPFQSPRSIKCRRRVRGEQGRSVRFIWPLSPRPSAQLCRCKKKFKGLAFLEKCTSPTACQSFKRTTSWC